MTTWADEYVNLLEDCEKRSERLSDWELGFLDSLQRQLADGRRGEGSMTDRELLEAAARDAGTPLETSNQ